MSACGNAKLTYRIQYSPEIENHLRTLTARQRGIVLDTVRERLSHQPTVETRNRKPLHTSPLASWELRIGDLRVYYKVESDPQPVVYILAVGVKDRNQVRVGREAVQL